MGKTKIPKKPVKLQSKKSAKTLNDVNLLESVNVKGLSDLEMCHAYMARASELENDFKPKKALIFYNKCIELLNPKSGENKDYLDNLIKCLESSAYILMEIGKNDEARERLLKVTVLNPDVGYEKYMFLAQLSSGDNAVNLYDKGVFTIEKQIRDSKDDLDKLKTLSFDLSQSYCALAELYMTDLCDKPEAETKCMDYVEKAKTSCPTNPQAFLIAASFSTVKSKNDDAKENLKKCLDLWWPPVRKFLDDMGTEDAKKNENKMDQDAESDDDNEEDEGGQIDLEELTGIPFEGHIAMARNLYEVELFQEAVDVLEVLLEENDEEAEIYYLLAHCGAKLNWKEEKPDQLRYYATICKVISTKMQDDEVVAEMKEIIDTLPESPDGEMDDFDIPDTDDESEVESMDEDCSNSDDEEDAENEEDSDDGKAD